MTLSELQSFDSAAQAKRNLRSEIEKVSARLGNTPTICRKCYIHPEVLNSYMDGNLVLEIKSQVESELRSDVEDMKPEEAAVLALLRGRLAKQAEEPEHANLKKLSGKRRARALEFDHSRRACSIHRGDVRIPPRVYDAAVDLVEPDADRADQRMLRPSRRFKRAHRGWRKFLDEPASVRAAGCTARPTIAFR